jgi:transcription antitermination factor NusA-like protein
VGAGGEMTQALYAHMNNKKIKIIKNNNKIK